MWISSGVRFNCCDAAHRDKHCTCLSEALEASWTPTVFLGYLTMILIVNRKKGLAELFNEFVRSYKLNRRADEPTRIPETSSTMIDHMYITGKENIVKSGSISTGLSDH